MKYTQIPKSTINFITANYKNKTIRQLADETGVDYHKVYYVVNRLIHKDLDEEIIEDEPRQPIQRPPAVYSNPQYYKLCQE